jgi:hypothetical protein
MNIGTRYRTRAAFALILSLGLLSACMSASTPVPVTEPLVTRPAGISVPEVIVYASDLTGDALEELDFIDDPVSPGGLLIGLPNTGDELDPPPESDPHAIFSVPVESGMPYRCWIHMKVGEPKGRSTANIAYVQFSKSVNEANQEVFRLSTNSYLTAQGPTQPGWAWVSCDSKDGDSLIYFENSGETRVRIQAGAEGVGFDQFLLSPTRFLESSPAEAILLK